MADSRIIGNVVQPLARSVVEPSTTGVDANNSINQLTDSGESTTNLVPIFPQQNAPQNDQDNKENSHLLSQTQKAPEGNTSGLMNSKYAGTKDTDTDSAGTSRPGSISPTKMDSLKPKSTIRRTTFKKISVNKEFLKDSVPAAGPVSNALGSTTSKVASTAFSVPQPASRNVLSASKLKLVKTGASSQTSRPGSTGPAGSAGSKTGDQALPVWNKNLPTPPPPKKDVTDEELKLEFGIHLASRLVSDNESKEAKWADIDDDDDDWVPEAIAWNDGMKVTMDDTTAATTAVNAETTVSPPATHVEPVCPEPVKEIAPPKSPVPVPVVLVAPMKEESRPKTLVTEKPSSKPTETTSFHPIRASPWKIPPPNAGPPIASNHSLRNNGFPPPPPRHELGMEQSAQHTTNSSSGMKEVSAEVFDRSWRDRPVNHSARERELFNSETGQLEPVREARNGGVRQNRNDPPMHKHSVLQRPSGPAEPSAAFQQSRSSMSFHRPEDYGRRRASSNVSGGSGSTGGRRPSFSTGRFSSDQAPTPDDARFPGQDLRRGSFGYSNPFDNEGPRVNHTHPGPYSPKFQNPSPRMAVISPVMNHVRPSVAPNVQQTQPSTIPPAPVVDPNYEDLVIAQERIMKESSQLARKRRQEEEAKEETAKQERLKIKLEALEKQAKLREEAETAKQKAIQDKRDAEKKAAEELRLAEEKAAAEKKATDEKAAAEIKAQEQEALAKKDSEERLASEREHSRQGQFSDRSAREPAASFIRSRSPGNTSGIPTGPQTQGRRPAGHMQTQRSPAKNFAVLGNREPREQPWKSGSSGQWGSSGSNNQAQNPTDGNPWAPVGEKPRFSGFNGVGNGTFENRYSGFSARSNASTAMHGQQNRDDGRQGGRPGRSGHISPGFSRGTRPNDNISQEDRSQAVNRWNIAANTIQDEESTERRKNREDRLAREAEEAASGIKREPVVHPKISETWRKVEISDGQGQVDRKLVSISKIVRGEASAINKDSLTRPPATIGTTTQSTTGNSQLQRDNIPTGPAAGRPTSRFFPAAANLVAQHLGNPSLTIAETTSKINPPGSPPPPMSSEHPVHGDINSRVVHLPPSPQAQHASGRVSPSSLPNNNFHKMDNPKSPRYPLPSCERFELVQRRILESMGESSLKQQSSQQQSARPHPQDNNGLTSKDFSATKPSFEEIRGNINKPSVSLPGSSHGSKDSSEKGEASAAGEMQMDGGCILSKPDDEEFFHGLFERDFGSTPTVKIPHNHTPIYNGNPSKPPMSPLQKPRKARLCAQASQTINAFDPFDPSGKEFVNVEGKRFIPVHLPGGKESEVLCKVPEGKHRKRGSSSRNGSRKLNSGNGGHMGRGSSMGKRVAEPVQ
ncbi:hypothetical protein DFP73DRAFT_172909 [Morchella snyderi]|nr:hypothetical protein DFP73DRAFT_172909 [Morchella snyderi]